jgi:hypothetical protein
VAKLNVDENPATEPKPEIARRERAIHQRVLPWHSSSYRLGPP